MKRIASLLFATALAPVALAQNALTRPAPPQDRPLVILGATLHPVSGPPIERGAIRFEGGRIVALGEAVPTQGAEIVDATGKHVYPGLFAAGTVIGLVEVQAVRATVDVAETGAINPNVRAEVAVNPDSELIPVTRANGVLTVLTRPVAGAQGVITGSSAVLALDGWTGEDLTLRSPVGLHVQWPSLVVSRALPPPALEAALKGQREKREALERALEDAKAYRAAKAGGEVKRPDLRWEAMLPLLEGTLPLYVHADDVESIQAALDFTSRHGLPMVLMGGLEAWRVAPLLAARDVPVIVAGTHRLPLRRSDPFDAAYANPARLHAAGVRFAIAGPGDAFDSANERNLAYHAATAAAYGLPPEEALKAITLYPAQITGVADRIGSLEPGKDATLIVTDGDPLDIRTRVERAWIGGREVDLNNRHRALYEKYAEKYRQAR